MSRTGALLGLLAVVAVAAAVTYATSLAEAGAVGPVLNLAPPTERVRVEVLNAGGVRGRAREATLWLRDIGYDVVHFGNAARWDRESTVVVDRVGRRDLARAVADALGVDEVTSDPDPNLFVDVTVLLGSEWRTGTGAGPVEGTTPEREPWDPRGWFGI